MRLCNLVSNLNWLILAPQPREAANSLKHLCEEIHVSFWISLPICAGYTMPVILAHRIAPRVDRERGAQCPKGDFLRQSNGAIALAVVAVEKLDACDQVFVFTSLDHGFDRFIYKRCRDVAVLRSKPQS